ncbi:MAG: hypothetical protein AB7L90_01975 [Hyphomicrobiaceae bacterium]
MTAFVWQTLLLLGLSYVLGCWLACLVRRMVGVSARSSATVDPVPAGAIAGAAAAAAALRQAPTPSPQVVRQSAPVPVPVPMRDAFRRADTLEPAPESARPSNPLPSQAQSPNQAQSPQTRPTGSVDRFERALAGPPGGTASAAAAMSAPIRSAARQGADDLKRIRTIDADLEAALHKLGVRSFAEIGAWKPADVARVSRALGFKGRIEQQNWIEQAQILASGKDTYYSSRLGLPEATSQPAANAQRPAAHPVAAPRATAPSPPATAAPAATQQARSTPIPDAKSNPRGGVDVATAAAAAMAAAAAAARVVPIAAPSGAPASSPPPATTAPSAAPKPSSPSAPQPALLPSMQRSAVRVRDELCRIDGITPEIEQLLIANGIERFAQIARWGAADVERFGSLVGQPARIARENWIAQAERLERGEPAKSAAVPSQPVARVQAPSEPVPVTPLRPVAPPTSPVATPTAPEPQALASAPAGSAPAVPSVPAAPSVERPTAPAPTPASSANPPPPPSVTAPAAASADAAGSAPEPERSEIAHLRSVRSEGLRGQNALDMRSGGPTQDLKRIRGIGVLIEKKLNAMGVTRYEQIAKWTSTDIDRVSHVLDFKGRIERENWVEQARILASGGQTEFSRRADRSDGSA